MNVRIQWASAHINLPQIIPASECWKPEPPKAETIWRLVFEKVRLGATKHSMFDGGVSDVDQTAATYMSMAYPDISKVSRGSRTVYTVPKTGEARGWRGEMWSRLERYSKSRII